MAYSVKEIYYTLQGEGAQSGRAAALTVFHPERRVVVRHPGQHVVLSSDRLALFRIQFIKRLNPV